VRFDTFGGRTIRGKGEGGKMNQKQIRDKLLDISYYEGNSVDEILTMIEHLLEEMDKPSKRWHTRLKCPKCWYHFNPKLSPSQIKKGTHEVTCHHCGHTFIAKEEYL